MGEEQMLVAFEADCGELVPGRRLLLKGLREEGCWPDELGNRLSWAPEAPVPMVSLLFEVTPAVQSNDADAAQWRGALLADVTYATVPALTHPVDDLASMESGAAAETGKGAYGPYPVPQGTRQLTFDVYPYTARAVSVGAVSSRQDVGESGPLEGDVGIRTHTVTASAVAVGRLTVDLLNSAASWVPAT